VAGHVRSRRHHAPRASSRSGEQGRGHHTPRATRNARRISRLRPRTPCATRLGRRHRRTHVGGTCSAPQVRLRSAVPQLQFTRVGAARQPLTLTALCAVSRHHEPRVGGVSHLRHHVPRVGGGLPPHSSAASLAKASCATCRRHLPPQAPPATGTSRQRHPSSQVTAITRQQPADSRTRVAPLVGHSVTQVSDATTADRARLPGESHQQESRSRSDSVHSRSHGAHAEPGAAAEQSSRGRGPLGKGKSNGEYGGPW